jgi:hypothetical protein
VCTYLIHKCLNVAKAPCTTEKFTQISLVNFKIGTSHIFIINGINTILFIIGVRSDQSELNLDWCKKMKSEADLRREQQFLENVRGVMESQGARGILFDESRLEQLIREIKEAKTKKPGDKTQRDYRRLAAYDVIEAGGKELVIKKNRSDSDTLLLYISIESMFDILDKCHIDLGHKKTLSRSYFFILKNSKLNLCAFQSCLRIYPLNMQILRGMLLTFSTDFASNARPQRSLPARL